MKTVIGVDFGTQSARAVLVAAASGQVLGRALAPYAHPPGEDGLVWVKDYDAALESLLGEIAALPCRGDIAGICVDATSLTLVALAKDGRPLEDQPGMEGRPHARGKLWKRHTARRQAREALELARLRHEPFLGRTGGSISSEWTLPKLMETLDEDPQAYRQIDLALDLCEYLTFRLTGRLVRSTGSMSYKGLWAQDLGLPPSEYLRQLRPGLEQDYPRLMRGAVLAPGGRAGWLSGEWMERLGLSGPAAVAAGTLDGHTSLASMGALRPGDAALVVGTSNVVTVQTEGLQEMQGICGIAKDGLTPGLWGIDAGQSCTGDMLDWFIRRLLPGEYREMAEERGISPHALLAGMIQEPYAARVTAVDWWNGSRNMPCDLGLTGALTGLTLDTGPEDIYLALLQSIACGTREILDHCESCGIPIHRVLAGGGAAGRNRLLMEQYASLLGRPVLLSKEGEAPARGAAIFAAVAAGIYPDAAAAWQRMGIHSFETFQPDAVHGEQYQRIYQRNHLLRQLHQASCQPGV